MRQTQLYRKALFFGVLFGLLDALLESLFVNDGTTFIDVAFVEVSYRAIYLRASVLVLFVVFAYILGRARKHLTLTERQFLAVAEHANDAIISFTKQGVINFWNKKAEDLLGYSYKYALGKTVNFIIPKECQKSFDNGFPYPEMLVGTNEITLLCKQQQELCVELSLAVWLSNGDTLYTGILRDITERKRTAEALQASEAHYRTLFENMDTGCALHEVVWDETQNKPLNYIYLDTNQAFETLMGVSREQLIGFTVTEAFPGIENDTANWIERFGNVGHTGESLTSEEYSETLDKWLSIIAYQTGPDQFAVICTDITQRKQADNEYKRAQSALAVNAQQLARSNKDLEQFAYAASHDLQEPLRTISGYATLVQSRYCGALDDKGNHYVEEIVAGTERMEHLIESLLLFSRANRNAYNFREINCNALIDEVVADLNGHIIDSSAMIIYDQLPTIVADKERLKQVFQNLISNGLKFCNGEHPEIRIEAERDERAWRFAIIDNGIGIEEDYHEQIFLLFERLHNRDDYTGTGIGLALCKKIVERHGGAIWVESAIGKGSTFYFLIPDTKPGAGQDE